MPSIAGRPSIASTARRATTPAGERQSSQSRGHASGDRERTRPRRVGHGRSLMHLLVVRKHLALRARPSTGRPTPAPRSRTAAAEAATRVAWRGVLQSQLRRERRGRWRETARPEAAPVRRLRRRAWGTRSPIAPSNSSRPVAVTRKPGAGRLAGTMRIRSRRVRGWKCDTAVNTNIAAKANTSAPVHEVPWGKTPADPATRAATQAASITISGANRDYS